MAIWRLITHHEYPQDALNWYLQHHVIALGWGNCGAGDLRELDVGNQHEIANLVDETNKGECGRCLWDFWQEMQVDDLVILRFASINHKVVKVISDYFFDDTYPPGVNRNNLDGYYHRRKIELTQENPDRLWKQTKFASDTSQRFALCHRVYI